MDWISDPVKIVVIILIAIGSVVKSQLEAKAKRAQDKTPDEFPNRPAPRPRIMPSVPPPLTRANMSAPMSMAAVEAANETAKILKRQQDLAERLRQIRETKAITTGDAATTQTRIKKTKSSSQQVHASLQHRLQNCGEIRRAMVMREIFDSPVSLR